MSNFLDDLVVRAFVSVISLTLNFPEEVVDTDSGRMILILSNLVKSTNKIGQA